MTQLLIIPGALPKTYTLGYRIAGKTFRDTRYGPSLSFREAEWLLENERQAGERERRFANSAKWRKDQERTVR